MSGTLGPPISFALLFLFSFFSSFLLFHCILGRGQTLFGGKHCQDFTVREQSKNSLHVHRFERGSVGALGLLALFCSLRQPVVTGVEFGAAVRKKVKLTLFLEAIMRRGFPFMFSLRRFISSTSPVIHKLAFSRAQERVQMFFLFRIKYENV